MVNDIKSHLPFYSLSWNIVILGSSSLTAGNIKKGVSIFGVTGTFTGWVGPDIQLVKNGASTGITTLNYSTAFTYKDTVSGSSISFTGEYSGSDGASLRSSSYSFSGLENYKKIGAKVDFSINTNRAVSVTGFVQQYYQRKFLSGSSWSQRTTITRQDIFTTTANTTVSKSFTIYNTVPSDDGTYNYRISPSTSSWLQMIGIELGLSYGVRGTVTFNNIWLMIA
mgnify:CR=1 FL=1